MVRPDRLLAPDEKVLGEWRVKGHRLVVTDRRLLISKGGKVQDIGLQHIVSIEAETSWGDVIGGIVLVLLGLFIASVAPPLGILFILGGVAAAIWGFLNRYRLVVAYGTREVKLKNGPDLLEIASALRGYVMRVRQA